MQGREGLISTFTACESKEYGHDHKLREFAVFRVDAISLELP